jgi:hypothetical protein
MAASMVVRAILGAAFVLAAAGCGGGQAAHRELRLLAPPGLVELDHLQRFERTSGCRVDVRVYDPDEDVAAIARRRDVDAVARLVSGADGEHASIELARITVAPGLVITVPKRFARAYGRPSRPAGIRSVRWSIRGEGENPGCARRWLAYVTSQ